MFDIDPFYAKEILRDFFKSRRAKTEESVSVAEEYREKLKQILKVDVQIEDKELKGPSIKIPGPGILIPIIGTKVKNFISKENTGDQTDQLVKELSKQREKSDEESISLLDIIEEYKDDFE